MCSLAIAVGFTFKGSSMLAVAAFAYGITIDLPFVGDVPRVRRLERVERRDGGWLMGG